MLFIFSIFIYLRLRVSLLLLLLLLLLLSLLLLFTPFRPVEAAVGSSSSSLAPSSITKTTTTTTPATAAECSSAKAEETTRYTKVVVLGAGASGISAALKLHDMNITDFMIIEAQSFIGGRVKHTPFANLTAEQGAQWIYGRVDNPIYELAQKHRLRTVPSDKRNVVYFDEEKGRLPQEHGQTVSKLFDSIMNAVVDFADKRIKRNQVDLSARTGLTLLGWLPDTPLKAAVEYFGINWELAEPASLSSLDYATGTVDVSGTFPQGSDFVADHRGFNHILEEEAKRALKENDIRLLLNTVVTDIIYDDRQVTILTANGTKIIAQHALCTFSIGVLQKDVVRFSPKLPDWKKEALHSFHMATYTKIFVSFDENFWGDWQFALYASNKTRQGGDYTVWQNLAALSQGMKNNVLVVTTTHKESERIEAMTDQQVMQEIQQVLQRMFPDVDVPFPLDILIPRWHRDPLFFGTYSNWAPNALKQHHENLRAPLPVSSSLSPTTPRLWFAGEAMSQKYYGYLHGAYLDGQEAGEVIGQCVLKNNCSGHYRHHAFVTGCGDFDTEKQRTLRMRRYPRRQKLNQHTSQHVFPAALV